MYQFVHLKLKSLKKNERHAYQALLAPAWESPHGTLGLLNPEYSQIAIGAVLQEKPVGLVVATEIADKTWCIQSLFVQPEHRRKYLAEKLLKTLEKELSNYQVNVVVMSFKQRDAATILPLLEKLHWDGKRALAIKCDFEDVRKFHPAWFEKVYPLPAHYEILLWKNLTVEEVAALQERSMKKIIPAYIDPFQGTGKYEPDTSMALRYKGEVIGWVITRLLTPNQLDYFSIYVEYGHEFKGVALMMLVQSIKNQQNSTIQSATFYTNFLQVSMAWIRTIYKRLAPYTSEITLYQQAWKNLKK